MRREQSVEEISDGRKYHSEDLVKIGTNGCLHCCDCCRMDALIVLDPWDVYQLQKGVGQSLSALIGQTVRLEVIDGLIQPVLQMKDGICPYLDEAGRCRIHAYRPGICRLYPLGRSWEDRDFSYILQVHECTHCTGSKVKVKKWLQIPDLKRYEDYCRSWHGFLKQSQSLCGAGTGGQPGNAADNIRKIVCMQILEKCYLGNFEITEDFYPQFEDRLQSARQSLGIMNHQRS